MITDDTFALKYKFEDGIILDIEYDEEMTISEILGHKFKILSEEEYEEINIDNIGELNDTCYDINHMTDEQFEHYHNLTRSTLNEVIKAVKQLNKKMEE